LSLFRAMMTGHAGASTFHADSPREAVRRLTTVLGADAGVGHVDAIRLIAESVDLLVQIGIRGEVRRVTVIANIAKELKNGDIGFEPIFRLDDQSPLDQPRWAQTGELRPRILAETSL
jgi:pilus assembly protein CpaF